MTNEEAKTIVQITADKAVEVVSLALYDAYSSCYDLAQRRYYSEE